MNSDSENANSQTSGKGRSTLHVCLWCGSAILCTLIFYASIASLNSTIIEAATIAGDKMSPRLQPTEHNITIDGGVSIGNRRGSSAFDVGVTVGKSKD